MKADTIRHDLNQEIPFEGTKSALRYFISITRDLNFFMFIINTVSIADKRPYHEKMKLEKFDGETSDRNIIKNENPGLRIKKFRKHSQDFIEMIFSRLINNFQIYIVDLIREILQVKPEILINNQPTISISQVLKADTIGVLIQEAIESKVATLANKGFGYIEEWCVSNGIPITVANDLKPDIIEFIAIRNIIVHNRCLVDEKYLKAVPSTKYKLGELRKLNLDVLFHAINTLGDIVSQTDQNSINKYSLEKTEIIRLVSNEIEYYV